MGSQIIPKALDRVLIVLISVGATLGWEVLGARRLFGDSRISFNLRWSDVGVGRTHRRRQLRRLPCGFNLRWSDVGVGSRESKSIAIPSSFTVLISVGATLGWEALQVR